MPTLVKIKVTHITQIADQVFIFRFRRKFEFQAGQIIGITNNEALAPRLYSICSAPDDPEISILFQVKSDGALTPPLSNLKVGDHLWITPVQGKFIFKDEPAWWIATGTGIAPFYSMFENGQRPLKLIQGGRKKSDMYFNHRFSSLNSYVPCCSQDKGSDIFEGRLTKYIETLGELPAHINYYLCGSAEMVVDVRNLLIGKGIPFKHIITEIYF